MKPPSLMTDEFLAATPSHRHCLPAPTVTRAEWTRLHQGPRVDFVDDMQRGLCSFCCLRVTLANGHLEFHAWQDGRLRYPDHRLPPLAFFSHTKCGPDAGYHVPLKDLIAVEGEHGWCAHIREKTWGCATHFAALRLGEALRTKLAPRNATRNR